MRMVSLTLALTVLALAVPAFAKDTCNPSGGDACKVGDCLGGDVLGRDGLWRASSACSFSAAPSGTTSASRMVPASTTDIPGGPGGCVLRPGNPLGCGTGESPNSFMIVGTTTLAQCRSMGGTVVTAGPLSRCKLPMR